jgi:hypothetical protein
MESFLFMGSTLLTASDGVSEKPVRPGLVILVGASHSACGDVVARERPAASGYMDRIGYPGELHRMI